MSETPLRFLADGACVSALSEAPPLARPLGINVEHVWERLGAHARSFGTPKLRVLGSVCI